VHDLIAYPPTAEELEEILTTAKRVQVYRIVQGERIDLNGPKSTSDRRHYLRFLALYHQLF
jgi:hypothetical protein